MTTTLLRNARLLCPASGTDAVSDVLIGEGRIQHLGKGAPAATETIDATGHWLLPGVTDLSARLREPGAAITPALQGEARAALASGITTVVVPPDCRPVADTPSAVDRLHALAITGGGARVRVLGALTQGLGGEALAELSALKSAGVVGVTNALAPLGSLLVARRALDYAHGLDLTVHVLAMDTALANGGCAHEGAMATRLGLPSIPVAAEVAAIRQWISLVEDTGAAVHFGRLSSARGAELVESAQARGLPVTADVAAHQLFLTDAALEGFDPMAHVLPPLRSADDREALRGALVKGVIGAICSDHVPLDADAKVNPFPLTKPGLSGLDTLLPLSLRLVHEGLLSPLQLAARLCTGPATILNVPMPRLAVGETARLTLLDPGVEWTLDAGRLASRSPHTAFTGARFKGRVVAAFMGR